MLSISHKSVRIVAGQTESEEAFAWGKTVKRKPLDLWSRRRHRQMGLPPRTNGNMIAHLLITPSQLEDLTKTVIKRGPPLKAVLSDASTSTR